MGNVGWFGNDVRGRSWFGHDLSGLDWFDPALERRAATGLSATVNQAIETDLAQPIAVNPKRRLVGQIAETDLAQPLTRRKTRLLGQVVETDLAQMVGGATFGGTILGATELDLFAGGKVLTITLTGRTWLAAGATFDGSRGSIRTSIVGSLSGISDWDSAKSSIPFGNIVRTSDRLVTITLPALSYDIPTPETLTCTILSADTLQDSGDVVVSPPIVIRSVQEVAVAQIVETDLAQSITRRKAKLLGQTTETDLAQPITRRKAKLLGQTTETDLAQPITRRKAKLLGQTTETDLAQPITRLSTGLSATVNQAVETDLAQALTHRKAKLLGQTTETDLAQPVSKLGQKIVPVSQAAETDLAQPIAWAPKKRLVNQVVESETAQPLTHRKLRSLGIPLETDLAQALARSKARTLGQAVETDLAQAIKWAPKRRIVGQVFEVDFAQPVTVSVGEKLVNVVSVVLHCAATSEHVLSVTLTTGEIVHLSPLISRELMI